MTNARKGLATLVVIGVTGALAAFGTFAGFSDTTTNSGNKFTAGTVTLTNNSTSAMFNNVTGGTPGAPTVDRCIKVAYTGSLAATVKPSTKPARRIHLSLPDLVTAVLRRRAEGADAGPLRIRAVREWP